MRVLARAVMAGIVGISAFYFIFWMGSAWISVLGLPIRFIALLGVLAGLVAGVLSGAFVWRRSASFSGGPVVSMALGALVIGGIGFAAGFFGPILFTDGNQGP